MLESQLSRTRPSQLSPAACDRKGAGVRITPGGTIRPDGVSIPSAIKTIFYSIPVILPPGLGKASFSLSILYSVLSSYRQGGRGGRHEPFVLSDCEKYTLRFYSCNTNSQKKPSKSGFGAIRSEVPPFSETFHVSTSAGSCT